MPWKEIDVNYRDRKWLEEQYIKKELTMQKIAQKCDVALSTIHRWLHRNNIPVQHDRGAHTLSTEAKNDCELNPQVRDFFDGSLLGDGNLVSRSTLSARYQLGQKHREYCQWVDNYLCFFGIKRSGMINKYKGIQAYQYKTLDYGPLKEIYKKWYPEGKKKVPQNVILNPFSIRHWFIEDGSSWFNNSGTLSIQFATNGFDYKGVKFLSKKLAEILHVKQDLIHIYEYRGYRISFGEPNVVNRFYSYMDNLNNQLGDIYGYKWKGDYSALVS